MALTPVCLAYAQGAKTPATAGISTPATSMSAPVAAVKTDPVKTAVPLAPARSDLQAAPAAVTSSTRKGSVVDIITEDKRENAAIDSGVTHPPLKLTPDKSELVRLDEEAGSVILGNPNHLSILADNSRTLVLVPRAPGATYFTVLNAKGAVIMQRHVIVAGPNDKYVRIRRSCNNITNCQPTQVYYCPDICHEIIMGGAMDQNPSAQAPIPSGATDGGAPPPTPQTPEEAAQQAEGDTNGQ